MYVVSDPTSAPLVEMVKVARLLPLLAVVAVRPWPYLSRPLAVRQTTRPLKPKRSNVSSCVRPTELRILPCALHALGYCRQICTRSAVECDVMERTLYVSRCSRYADRTSCAFGARRERRPENRWKTIYIPVPRYCTPPVLACFMNHGNHV